MVNSDFKVEHPFARIIQTFLGIIVAKYDYLDVWKSAKWTTSMKLLRLLDTKFNMDSLCSRWTYCELTMPCSQRIIWATPSINMLTFIGVRNLAYNPTHTELSLQWYIEIRPSTLLTSKIDPFLSQNFPPLPDFNFIMIKLAVLVYFCLQN